MGCDGMSKNVWNKAVIKEVSEKTVRAANKTVEILLNKTVDVTPKDDGFLRQSLATEHATLNKPYAKVVSKGNIAPYNVRVHEMLDHNVRWTTPGTGPKFIEKTFRNNSLKTFNRVLKGEK